ncbi:hypothetical protein AMECASPLE_005996 [Ameca splendens]|uniref:Uncharacterized protein n=1 Tax=Ameca splendens TaxID=208324 RepID=A0ABV0ZX90_9TELE
MSFTALSSKDMLNGRKPKCPSLGPLTDSLEEAPAFSTSNWCRCSSVFSSSTIIFFKFQLNQLVKDAANLLSFTSYIILYNLCTCQGSPATVTFIHWAGIGLLGKPLLFSAKKARGREERGKAMTKEGGRRIERNCSDSSNIPAYCKLRRPS